MVEVLSSSTECFAVNESRNFTNFVTTSSSYRSEENPLSFIKGEELDKRLTLNFSTSAEDTSPSPSSSPTENCLLLIDLRSLFQYQESHVRQSINLTNCPLVCKRIQDGKLQIKEYLEARVMFDGTQDVVIYEQSGSEETDGKQDQETQEGRGVTDFAKLIFNNLTKVKCISAKIEILRGGFDSFRKNYPKHCTQGVPLVSRFVFMNCNDDEMAFLNWEASEIRENLFVGALHDAQDDDLLDRLGITHILNCCKTDSRKDDRSGKYRYLHLLCDDNLQQCLDDKLGPAFKFIDSAMQEPGAKVLIHCYAGISRSAAITIAYMMYNSDLTYEQSYRELKQKRRIVAPNINFVSQLMKYDEEKQRTRRNYCMTSFPKFSEKIAENNSASAEDVTSSMNEQSGFQGNVLETSDQVQKMRPDCINLGNVRGRKGFNIPLIPGMGQQGYGKNPCGGRLAAKRKMLAPIPVKLAHSSVEKFGGPVVASAPIMATEYNPFATAFKKANSESGESLFTRKMEILSE